MSFQNSNNSQNKNFTPINHQIKAPKVLCIDCNNDNIGIIDTYKALKLANEQGLDLVQIAVSVDRTPTCRITNYGKFKYEQSKKQKAAAKSQRESVSKIKEIKFRPSTDVNDLKTKANKAAEFLDEGHKVKISILFKGREISYQEVAYETLNTFLNLIPTMQVIEKPLVIGRVLSVLGQKKTDLKIVNVS